LRLQSKAHSNLKIPLLVTIVRRDAKLACPGNSCTNREIKETFLSRRFTATGSTVLGEILNQKDNGAAYGIPNWHQPNSELRDRSWSAKEVLGNQLFFKYLHLQFWRPKKRGFWILPRHTRAPKFPACAHCCPE